MAGRAGSQSQPTSVAEGMADALRDLSSAMTAPDAPAHAQDLMALQAQMLTVFHKVTGTGGAPGGQPGQAPPGAGAPPGAAPGGPPPGGGAGGPGGMNLALLQGGQGGPSQAAKSPMSPEMMRQIESLSAAGGTT